MARLSPGFLFLELAKFRRVLLESEIQQLVEIHMTLKIRWALGFLIAIASVSVQASETYAVTTEVYFSPNGGAQDAVIHEIHNAQRSIFVQAYSFTNEQIVKALIAAQKRGVNVYVVLDKSNRSDNYSAGDFTYHFGIATYIDDKHPIAHSKIMIIDKETVITGSFNFTNAAERKNAENLLIIHSPQLANAYMSNWVEHQKHSLPYQGREQQLKSI